jgi:hypothetical protein
MAFLSGPSLLLNIHLKPVAIQREIFRRSPMICAGPGGDASGWGHPQVIADGNLHKVLASIQATSSWASRGRERLRISCSQS